MVVVVYLGASDWSSERLVAITSVRLTVDASHVPEIAYVLNRVCIEEGSELQALDVSVPRSSNSIDCTIQISALGGVISRIYAAFPCVITALYLRQFGTRLQLLWSCENIALLTW